ncbi:hypothetical protein N0V88_006968 [Collariella sp. IMI 366227]|nr:hypothetical protein N0V88_006968 [Collariella sp. IMI 366227]
MKMVHRCRLKAKLRLLEKKVVRMEKCEKQLGRALQQLESGRTQIDELNAAMTHVLGQVPHGGQCFDQTLDEVDVGMPCEEGDVRAW